MAQFTLQWDNTAVLLNPNAINQRASYRRKSVGGAYITAGFTPANDLAKAVTSATSPNSLLSNVLYEFKVETICTENGPTLNDNGVIEGLIFSCLVPTIEKNDISSTIILDVTGTDITKAKFTIRKSSDNSIVGTATNARAADEIQYTHFGLTPGTNYYWQVELIATVNTVEKISSSPDQLGASCSPYPFTTDASPICDPVTSVDVSSVEIP